jgi:beta-mannanase
VYTVVKAANPTIRFGPVYMAYWWDPTERSHYVGDPASWWPGEAYADFAGLDWYGFEPEPMTTSRSFTTWYETVAPTGLPLVIAEYGQYFQRKGQPIDPAKEEARASAIRQDATWIFAHPQFEAWLYWEGAGDSGEWRLRDRASQLAWRSVAERGCSP